MDKKYDFYHGKGMEKQGSDNGLAKYVDFDKGEFKMQCKSSEHLKMLISYFVFILNKSFDGNSTPFRLMQYKNARRWRKAYRARFTDVRAGVQSPLAADLVRSPSLPPEGKLANPLPPKKGP